MEKPTMIKVCNRVIEYSFYALFFLVPLVFTDKTSELFELNKMWLTWGLTIIIGMFWFTKMTLERKLSVQRTSLDIPIGLFLLSQIISTIFSLDRHVSLWGYYSRFNGGLLSTFSYIFLYYAFLSNFRTNAITVVKRSLFFSLTSGLIVALWGLPSHFGYDPTCLIFRGTFDVSCWTADFLPKVRIFSTMGQPDWLAAHLAILIPISLVYAISNWKLKIENWKLWMCLLLAALFYVDLLYTQARSGFLGIWFSLIFFAVLYYWVLGRPKISMSREKLKSPFVILIFGLLVITFIIGTPIGQLRIFSLGGIQNYFQKIQAPKIINKPASTPAPPKSVQSFESGGGGTESGKIRLLVWAGAINAWKANPLFGTGVETFAFAYYKYKPVAQNLTSEWNFLYNKAHNEYLNYLATTGLFGLGTYLLMIGWFICLTIKQFKMQNAKLKITIQNSKLEERLSTPNFNFSLLILNFALLASYASILIINFFGFSVVITNIYLFMIPAFIFVLTQQVKTQTVPNQVNKAEKIETETSVWQWTPIFFFTIIGIFMLFSLFRFWQADVAFAHGYNLDRAAEYQQAYQDLHKAVKLRGNEPVFKDELSINNAIIAAGLVSQKDQDEKTKEEAISVASTLAQEAINISNEIISQNPNNVVFWKTRVRLFHTLSQVDSRYLSRALDAIEKASALAPNDATIWYNLGVLYGQNNNIEKGMKALEKTIALKPDYREAHYALGLFYHAASLDKSSTDSVLDKSGKVVTDENLNSKAIAQMQYILDYISPTDTAALESIKAWAK